MSNQEKQHTSHKTSMQHLRYLNSFMEEIDREVMSLTDRAFKSLCIGDEAIYNESEFFPSPVNCHKPLVEEVSKKTQDSLFSAVKKLNSHPLNGVNDALRTSNKSSKDLPIFAVFAAKKNGKGSKMTNGDSWDKSALLSNQNDVSEFSSNHHSLAAEHLSVENNFKSAEKGSANKSNNDVSIPSGKSSKSKHGKNNKLKKLNSKNFFLHSEFSPFLSWGDFNKLSKVQEHISEITLRNRSPEWYDSPLYKELTAAHGHYKLSLPTLAETKVEQCPKQIETHQSMPQLESVQSTQTSVPPKPDIETEHIIEHNILSKGSMLAAEQRCNSEKGEPCVPWRKNRSRAKSALPVGHSFFNLSACERSNPGEGGAPPTKKLVQTLEGQTSSSSTPFSISQLLTPVIPSRHGTGTSEILLSTTALEIPPLSEREMHPLPEIKREGYKSIASSLLFNLKDNRKRVKAMYSPPKFKGLDAAGQSKGSPLPKLSVSKDVHEIAYIAGAKDISPACQKAITSQMRPLLDSEDTQTCSHQGIANGGMPDDYLALSLLQSRSALKSKRSPAANKAEYPSLQLYQNASPEEVNIRANAQIMVDTSSQVLTDGDQEHCKYHNPESNIPRKLFKGVLKELQGKSNHLESVINTKKPTESLNRESVLENKSSISPSVSLTKPDEQAVCDGSQTKDQFKTKGKVSPQKSPVKEKEPNRKDAGAKHVFSTRQNNYIKSQRIVSTDNDNNDYDDGSSADKVLLAIKDQNYTDEWYWHSKNPKTKEIKQEEHNKGIYEDIIVQTKVGSPLLKESVNVKAEATTVKDQNKIILKSVLEIQSEQPVKNEAFSTKGNTSAKRALLSSNEQVPNEKTVPLKKENIVIDKFELAQMALEEVIAEREQRKLKSKAISNAGGSINNSNIVGCENQQDGHELPIGGEEQQPTRLVSSDKGRNKKDGKGQNSISAFKTSGQTVQIMSEEVAKHSVSHEAEVKLASPYEQEVAVEQCQRLKEQIKYTEINRLYIGDQESNTHNASKGNKVCGFQEKELIDKYISHAKESRKIGDNLESGDIQSLGHYMEKLGVEEKGSSYKPEVPPRRGRSNSQSDDRVVAKTEGNKDLKRQGDTSERTEKMDKRDVRKGPLIPSKNHGPVRGNVSALKEKYDKASGVHRKDVLKCLPVGGPVGGSEEGPNELATKDKIKHKNVVPKLTVSGPESEMISITDKDMESEKEKMFDSSSKESEKDQEHSGSQRKHDDTQDFQKVISDHTQDFKNVISDLTHNRQEIQNNKVNGTKDKEEVSVSLKDLGDNQNKSKGPCKSDIKEFLSGLLGLSSSEQVKSVGEDEEELTGETTFSFESIKAEKGEKDSITVHDILGQSQSLSSSNDKQTHHSSLSSNSSELSLFHESEQGSLPHLKYLSNKTKVCDVKETVNGKIEDFQKQKIDSCPFRNHESESVVFPLSDVGKRGLVHSLIEPAKNLTQISHIHNSLKDLHEMGHHLSQREGLNGSEKGEEDLDIFKDCVHSPVNTPAILVRSPQQNQPIMHLLSPPASQLNAVKNGKLSVGSISVSEEEEQCSAVSTLSEEMGSCTTCVGDTMQEIISSTAPIEDAEGSKVPSERSGSVCSGNDSLGQNKPPVVPPKTEKALRRAMKLATRRMQKAEANSKSECKGRSSDKNACLKAERRHHSNDKVHSDRLEHRSPSSDRLASRNRDHYLDDKLDEPKPETSEKHARRHSGHRNQNMEENYPRKTLHRSLSSDRLKSKHSEHYLDDTFEPKTQRSEKNVRRHGGHKSQNIEAKDSSKTLQQATKIKDRQTIKTSELNSHDTEKQQDHKSNPIDNLENSDTNNDTDRLGRSNVKYSPRKLEHRTQSLDRFLRDKHVKMSNSPDKAGGKVTSEFSMAQPFQQNCIEQTYAPATTNIVTHSFPITQRKLLQDPESGQYFLVDMPVQVKTKTFFDPETKSYLQLPVQSPEGAERQVPPLDVMNTPPLVLYQGFVPVPVSSLPSQKSIVRTAGSLIPPDDLEDFYQKHSKGVHPYIEPVYTSQEHTPEEETDSVR
ncbi:uncharacterized protein LOC127626509 [Xyrauchen texanus]|uniref:uncharacterized protein LOC127626509 n=1 Tax=Xyrauchen texanus TaxID=154827 RepID=UPI00224239D2|nr:uncharacterized protein LOC127626509 [Xyrauchen texanus]